MEKVAWLVLTVVTLVAAISAQWRPRALIVGRVTLGIYYVAAGALVNAVYLATGQTYATFADAARDGRDPRHARRAADVRLDLHRVLRGHAGHRRTAAEGAAAR
jgi:hypothetical protein